MIPMLVMIILMYELRTRAFTDFVTGTSSRESSSEISNDPKHHCDRRVRLADYDQLPAIMLASYPGSGNTYVDLIMTYSEFFFIF